MKDSSATTQLLNSKSHRTLKEASTLVSTMNASQTFEQIIECNKNNRKINQRSLLSKFGRQNMSQSMKSGNMSQVSLTEFYMSRSQCDITKLKKTYKN